ncbi:aspartic peptidase domain-containing protein [Favolaschia claudopus]|uniref:Aspartic peptidase domain-containing protein n=1 Tax=Favolaschia claudopus TaxID=2862362 RepID=A0AAW0EFP3_9AGAR
MFLLIWLVPGSLLSLFSLAYAEPVHLPLIRQVLPHSGSAMARSLLGVERRNRVDVGLGLAPSEEYLIPITFGTPTQTLPLILSLTIPGAMVPGCFAKVCSDGSNHFNYTKSRSARNQSTSMQTISVFDATFPGSVFTDVIGFGPFSISDASFFVYDDTIILTGDPGIFGVGFPSASFQNLPSLWQSLLSSNPVDAPEMGIWLSRAHNTSTSKAPTPGVFTFGGTNSSLYTGDIEFLDSTSTSAWVLNITTLTIQGHEVPLTQGHTKVAFDLEGTGIYGPTSSVAAFWEQVPGASSASPRFLYPCSTTLNVSVSFGGRSWTLDPAELNAGKLSTVGNDSDPQCFGAIEIGEAEDQPGWVFGEAFLRGVYTVLRQGNPPAIGFADLSEQGGGALSPTLHSTASSGSASSPPSSTVPPRSTPPVSAKKAPVAAVIGGVIGALVLCAALLTALLLTRRRRRKEHAKLAAGYDGGINWDLVPEPFVASDQRPEMASVCPKA